MANNHTALSVFLAGTLASSLAFAGPTKVGNGDDGRDLEGAATVSEGVLLETQQLAVKRLRDLNVQGIEGLGMLLPEVERAQLLLSQMNVAPLTHEKSLQEVSDNNKLVYARTFAEPHAPTRFFPAALELDKDQLVALHIHEALHRSLPEKVRENEEVVMKMTMAMTTQGASYDRVQKTARALLPTSVSELNASAQGGAMGTNVAQLHRFPTPDIDVGYAFRNFTYNARRNRAFYGSQGDALHVLSSGFKFGKDTLYATNLNLKMSLDGGKNGSLKGNQELKLGAIDGELETRIAKLGDSDLMATARGSFSIEPYRGFSRDLYVLGLKSHFEDSRSLIETYLSFTPGSVGKIGPSSGPKFERKFETVYAAGLRGGFLRGAFSYLATFDLLMSNGWSLKEDSGYPIGESSKGRFSIFAVGPEIRWRYKASEISAFAKQSLQAQQGLDLSDLGDPMGQGLGERTTGVSLKVDL